MILVGNVRHGRPGVYVGRKNGNWPESPLANPFKITGAASRGDVIARYRVWLMERIAAGDGAIIQELRRLKDLSRTGDLCLLCWCRPLPCHGEVIREVLESME